MRFPKRHVVSILALIIALLLPGKIMAQEPEEMTEWSNVMINGVLVPFTESHPALIRNNRLYVPADFFEHSAIQANVLVSEYHGNYYASMINQKVRMSVTSNGDSYTYLANELDNDAVYKVLWEDASPFVYRNRLMIPLRQTAERLGVQVGWNPATKTALLTTDETYQKNLDPAEDWKTWMGEKPIEEDDPSGAAITEEELKRYFAEENRPVEDYKILSRYSAAVLELEDDGILVYGVDRLRNGSLGAGGVGIHSGADEEGFSVHRTHGVVGLAVHDQAMKHEIEYAVVSFYDQGHVQEVKLEFEGRQGFLVPQPAPNAVGIVTFYGKNGFIHEARFW